MVILTNEQRRLYEYFLENAKDRYVSKDDICDTLCDIYPRYKEKASELYSSSYRQLRRDIRAINSSDVENIIISDIKGYKVANEDEAIKFIERRIKRDCKSLKINWNLKRKIGNNGQFHFSDDTLKEIKTFVEQ